MEPTDLVLAIVAESPGGVPGRTYLQKVAYFVGEKLGLELRFQPHYYGPYSRTVSGARTTLVERGILTENMSVFAAHGPADFETRRYSYKVADGGAEYVSAVAAMQPSLFKRVGQIARAIAETNADYRQLSGAAKVHYVLKTSSQAMTPKAIEQECQALGWDLAARDVQTAVSVLQGLNLVAPAERDAQPSARPEPA